MDKNLGGRWPLVENEGMKLYMDIMGSLIPSFPTKGQPKKHSTKSFVVEGRNVLHHAVLSDDAETVPWASSTRRLSLTMSWTWAAENFEKYVARWWFQR